MRGYQKKLSYLRRHPSCPCSIIVMKFLGVPRTRLGMPLCTPLLAATAARPVSALPVADWVDIVARLIEKD